MCKKCKTNPVYEFTNKTKLCKHCFIHYLQKKVLYTIRKFDLIKKGETIGVAVSGGKDSMTLLYILNSIAKERNLKIMGFIVNEGIKGTKREGKGYREKILPELRSFCKKNNIKLVETSFKKKYGFNIQEILKKIKSLGISTCYACSLLKRPLLNEMVRKYKCDKIATGHSLDDEAETIILNLTKGSTQLLAKLGPIAGVLEEKKFIPRIKPLYFCSSKEIGLYAKLKELPHDLTTCPIREDTLRVEIRNFLKKLEIEHPEIKSAIVNSYLNLMPLLKTQFKSGKIQHCKICEEPSSNDICKRCIILKKLLGKRISSLSFL
jgi:uncharacterized protein (TIGR00269 family)